MQWLVMFFPRISCSHCTVLYFSHLQVGEHSTWEKRLCVTSSEENPIYTYSLSSFKWFRILAIWTWMIMNFMSIEHWGFFTLKTMRWFNNEDMHLYKIKFDFRWEFLWWFLKKMSLRFPIERLCSVNLCMSELFLVFIVNTVVYSKIVMLKKKN